MGLFSSFPLKKSSARQKERAQAWAVILKGAPDKKVEENLVHLFTDRLDLGADDALKIVRSAPLIIFNDQTSRDAEQIKLILNQTGARTAISNDPTDLKSLPRVAWPRKIAIEELSRGEVSFAPPSPSPSPLPSSFKSSKPVVPIPPKTPISPTPTKTTPLSPPVSPPRPAAPPASTPARGELTAALERVRKLEQETSLLSSQLDHFRKQGFEGKTQDLEAQLKILSDEKEEAARERDQLKSRVDGLEEELHALKDLQSALENEKGALEIEKERLALEKEQALLARGQAEKALDKLRKELSQSQDIRVSLQKEITFLREEKGKLVPEVEKIKAGLEAQLQALEKQAKPIQSQLKLFEKLLETLREPKS